MALQGHEPLTMAELLRKALPVNRASVYRTISLFEELGIVQRLQTGWKYRLELSDVFHDHHHHATCLVCGVSNIIPENDSIEQFLKQAAQTLGFQLERHQLELQGYCTGCRQLLRD